MCFFAREYDDDVIAHICPFDNILIRKGETEILGRYVAAETVGEDCLLTYRKYVKDEDVTGWACLFYELHENTQFYHSNPFFDIAAVSDDDAFLARCSLPF